MDSEIHSTDFVQTGRLIEFLDEVEAAATAAHAWKLLIVDDEAAVHQATVFAMRDMVVLDRKFEFLHAYSAAEARAIIEKQPDLAVILLDVVMESEHAGLDLVRVIRQDLARDTVRIILRTGQPGYAPEIETIRQLDINDYKTKSELTKVRLFTCLTVALRTYQQLQNLERTRQGLQLIVRGSTMLCQLHGLQTFAEGVVTQLSALLDVPAEGLICAQGAGSESGVPVVIAAAGRFRGLVNLPFSEIQEERLRVVMSRCLSERRHLLGQDCCLYFCTSSGRSIAAYINSTRPLSRVDEELLEVFCAAISAGLENLMLYSRLNELARTLGKFGSALSS
jgi:diguanylate cyclase